ncbi:NEDD8-CONJUGATING ENZYME UBC12-LIKE-RELATED [Salix koriyanagi]|uniref:NEDD8-CONJUGATING ENZYME UBC12-LIKE-RELATED n=1 Tax=Salix koriyanagi TaxID=2511006 RepID=A0A9Q0P6D0_9ROSI|nr:NEDD8-CONJUGATING ENZYME UBC12-LIKE-RELATED [Salix koriyanagi]
MIRLFKVKEKQRELAENANGGVPIKKQTAGELRLHKDISELNLPSSCTMTFPNGKDNLMNFEVSIRPDEGYYLGGTFLFSFQVSPIYPHEAPKVKCKTKGLPSKHRFRRKCLPQYLARRLETCPQYKHYHLRIISSLHGTKLGGSS